MDIDAIQALPADCTTREVAQALGMAVRSVQLMVDRGELQAWKTPGGHRRIARASVLQWLQSRPASAAAAPATLPAAATPSVASAASVALAASTALAHPPPPAPPPRQRPCVLLIEDSTHFQNLVQLLLAHEFPEVDLHLAQDGIVGLAMAGQLQPDVLLVDILLPGIDGATLVARLRTHPQFQHSRLIVITSLDANERSRYAFALEGLPVVHKPQLVQELPALLRAMLA